MAYFDVNYVAVLLAAIVNMVIGAFWYSPAGFGNQWMRLIGISKKQISDAKKKGMTKSYIVAFFGSIVIAFALAHMTSNAATLIEALIVAELAWLGFIAAVMLGDILWEGRPAGLYMINVGYYLVTFNIMAAIIYFI